MWQYRKFYLYEDIPHCFIAIELKNIKYKNIIDDWRKTIFDGAPYIYRTYINEHAGDDAGNGKGFLNVLNAMTDFYLFNKDNKITHLIHCCMEFMTQSRRKECEFYQNISFVIYEYPVYTEDFGGLYYRFEYLANLENSTIKIAELKAIINECRIKIKENRRRKWWRA